MLQLHAPQARICGGAPHRTPVLFLFVLSACTGPLDPTPSSVAPLRPSIRSASRATVDIHVRDADGEARDKRVDTSVIALPHGCFYMLTYSPLDNPVNWPINEVTSDLGHPQRYFSPSCRPATFAATESEHPQHFEEQTVYYWSKRARDYAQRRLWITPPGWSLGPIKHANDEIGPEVLSDSSFDRACLPDPRKGCMRAFPHEGPKFRIRTGHVNAALIAHEFGHYAAGFVFGHMDTFGYDFTQCDQRSFQETIAPMFGHLLLHDDAAKKWTQCERDGVPQEDCPGVTKISVLPSHDAQWVNQCGEDDYEMGLPLIEAFQQALWGNDFSNTLTVPWHDPDEANRVMAHAFSYALALNRGHKIDLLAYAMLDWLEAHHPGVSEAVRQIFAAHGMARGELGDPCSVNDGCLSGYCDAGWGTSDTNRCMPGAHAGGLGDLCSNHDQCASNYCASLRFDASLGWVPGNCATPGGIGSQCPSHEGCADGRRCDAHTLRCVPDAGEGTPGHHCSHDDQCASWVCRQNQCASRLVLGRRCQEHVQCASGVCDRGWGSSHTATCVPNWGHGTPGDHCTHDDQCAIPNCSGLRRSASGTWIPGTCSTSMLKDLGDPCQEHHQCVSAVCDRGWGSSHTATCVPNWYTGAPGQHCSHHLQCQRFCCVGLAASNAGTWIPGTCY